jgi:hypothetical protein
MMNRTIPSKESVRAWLKHEMSQHRPPPDPKQIRRELGWGLIVLTPGEKDKRN